MYSKLIFIKHFFQYPFHIPFVLRKHHNIWQFWRREIGSIGGFPDSSVGKESACNVGDPGSIPEFGRSTGEGIGYPLQYSWASLVAQLVKNPLQCGKLGFNLFALGRSPGEGKGYWLQYSGLENSMDCSPWGCKESDMIEQLSFSFPSLWGPSLPLIQGVLGPQTSWSLRIDSLFYDWSWDFWSLDLKLFHLIDFPSVLLPEHYDRLAKVIHRSLSHNTLTAALTSCALGQPYHLTFGNQIPHLDLATKNPIIPITFKLLKSVAEDPTVISEKSNHRTLQRLWNSACEFVPHGHSEKCVLWTLLGWVSRS